MVKEEKIQVKAVDYADELDVPGETFGRLRGDKVMVPDGLPLYERSGFGELVSEDGSQVELSAEEALYLFQKGKLSVVFANGKKAADLDDLLAAFLPILPEIYIRFQLYRDLRDRGFVVRSGLKYGTHFRVYDRGVKPIKGAREEWEHAKYLAHALPESATYTIAELSRFVRLSHSVRKILWLGVIDGEGDVTYFQITRATP
jgi:tRNA-intron endonuclease, archaea type